MLSRDIRDSFIDFFVERGHLAVSSASLVPRDDPTLLFTNAGMVQFKDYFLGVEQPPSRRAVTAQKCLRVSGKHNDLENVGPSPRHHTFFEMLGNFSFGDYFKAEAIESAWKLVTEVWDVPPAHLFATVFEQDDEAAELWVRISGLPRERVLRCGEKDNFWAMGDTGPCGPCSEIFIDMLPTEPAVPWEEGSDSGRYLEIWNLVFMQFARHEDGTSDPLPNPSIDTGAGLERVAATLQGAHSNYDTDLFEPLLDAVAAAAGCGYGNDREADVSLRVIADHLRAIGFLLADGVLPGNEGRGYVLRRILRRASRHGMKLGFEEPFLAGLLPALEPTFGGHYPELEASRALSSRTVTSEETRFLDTVALGAGRVQQAIEKARSRGRSTLDGEAVFRLYDTFGLPLETMREIAQEEQFRLDETGFEAALERQRHRSRTALGGVHGRGLGAREAAFADGGLQNAPETEFVGYRELAAEAEVVALDGSTDGDAYRARALSGGGYAVFDRTPFYAEAGGQVGDVGWITWPGGHGRVLDTFRESGHVVHRVEVEGGALEIGATVTLAVDEELRRAAERHHTATHLLHAALRHHLGDGVRQAGSLVAPNRLRFDFTHGEPVTVAECEAIEDTVNEWVRRALPVGVEWRGYDEAVAAGAIALFGEKYGDRVRTVEVPGFSLELCGGCHVRNSGEVGPVVVVGERGVAAGVRRIEALAGTHAEQLYRRRGHLLATLESELGASGKGAADEVRALKDRLRQAERELSRVRLGVLAGDGGAERSAAEGGDGAGAIAGVDIVLREVPASNVAELRSLADVLRGRLDSGVVVLGALDDGKAKLVASVTKDLVDRVDAAAVARAMGASISGSGGGRPDFAQAGGRAEDLNDAFNAARRYLEDILSP